MAALTKKFMNPFKTIKYHLYLLQLENYELGRFWKLLIKRGWFLPKEQRKNLVWTLKAGLLLAMAVFLHILFCFLFFYFLTAGLLVFSIEYLVLSILAFLILNTLYPILYTLAWITLWPIDFIVKSVIIFQANLKINKFKKLKIVGIAGSYGKTTIKDVLAAVLSAKFNTMATPESVNTPVGIARWVLKKLNASTQIMIVEMGEHYRGDIKDICNIARPDISVITGINEAHLERMKTLDSIIVTIFEAVSVSKAGATIVLNADDKNIMANYKKFVWPDHKLEFFTKNSNSEKCKVKSEKFNTTNLCWDFFVEGANDAKLHLLGEYALGDADASIKIGLGLGMSPQEIIAGIKNIKPVEHRLQPIKSPGDVLVIDDSYNGNPDGVREAIKVLSRFSNRRKIYITPGLVETGKAAAEIHREIGKQLAGVADVAILIKNSVTGYIEEGIKSGLPTTHYPLPTIFWFNSAPEAHAALKNILKPGDVILFQNDWGDNYL